VKNWKLVLLSLFVLGAAGVLTSFVGGKDVQALPVQETYHVYYWDEAMTQYAGEELILSCRGRSNRMLNGTRAYHYVIRSEPCHASGGAAGRSCEKCTWYRSYPHNPICDSPVGMMCPPYVLY
jgi:hypothetical protein